MRLTRVWRSISAKRGVSSRTSTAIPVSIWSWYPRFENVRNVCNVGKVRIGEHQRWLEERFTAAMEGGPHPYYRFINFEYRGVPLVAVTQLLLSANTTEATLPDIELLQWWCIPISAAGVLTAQRTRSLERWWVPHHLDGFFLRNQCPNC